MTRLLLIFAACGARTAIDLGDADTDTDSDSATATEDCDDDDGDGYGAERCGGDDCDDSNDGIHPGAPDDVLVDWTSQTIEPEGGGAISLAIAGDGSAYVSYRGASGALRHATDASGAWIADELSFGDGDPSTSVDRDRIARVASASNGDIVYGKKDGADWAIQAGISTALYRIAPSTIVGPDRRAGICFVSDWESSFPALRWAAEVENGGWSAQTLVEQVSVGKDWETPGCDVGTDGEDIVLAFTNGAAGSVGWGRFDGSDWTVADLVSGGGLASIGVDGAGVPTVFYRSSADATLHAIRGGDALGWTDAEAGGPGVWLVSATDGDHAQVAYVTEALWWGVWNGEWLEHETVPGSDGIGAISLGVGVDGQPRIAAGQTDRGAVLFVREVEGDGVDQDCDGIDG